MDKEEPLPCSQGKGLAEGRLAWGCLVGITSADSGARTLSLGCWSLPLG